MKLSTWSGIFLVVAVFAFAATSWAQATQPSLGDLVRQQRAESKAKAKRVITEDEMPQRPEPAPPSAKAEQPTAAEDKVTPPKKADSAEPKADAAKPADSPNSARLQELKADEKFFNERIKATEEKLAAATDDDEREALKDMLRGYQSDLEQNRKDQEQLNKPVPPKAD